MTVVKHKKVYRQKNLNLKIIKNWLEASQFDNGINYVERNKTDKDSIKEIIFKKSILKIQQRFKSERHNVFTEKINKIALSWNDDKIIQWTDLIKTCI